MSYVLVVTGTRDGRNDTWQRLDELVAERGKPRLVVLGGDENNGKRTSRGVDFQAREWCVAHRIQHVIKYALWDDEPRAAGPNRNSLMAHECGSGDVCLALPGPKSKGTHDCARKCEARGAEVLRR